MKASVSLANKRIGALLVLQRGTDLRDHVEGGVRVGGHVSRELLLSIFHSGGALHDGAVIVREDRIAAAACMLPLSETSSLDRDLGTRHRAAVFQTQACRHRHHGSVDPCAGFHLCIS